MPKISVIIPIYNVEPYLHRCVDSILNQTFTDFELILVDDGSPDGCGAICDAYQMKDDRVVVIHQKNGGLSAARNAGIDWAFANSDSEWITFIDSDDWVHELYLQSMIEAVENTGFSIAIVGYEETSGKSPVVDMTKISVKKWNTRLFFCEHNVNAIIACGKLYKKNCFEKIRYPVGKIHEDEFVTYKILFEYQDVVVIDQPLYAYFQNADSITGARWKPSRLIATEALNERVQYFIACNNEKMFLWSIKTMFGNLQWHLMEIRKYAPENREPYETQILQLFKKRFKQYRKYLSISTDERIYWVVHPHFTKIYCHLRRAREVGFRGTFIRIKEKLEK